MEGSARNISRYSRRVPRHRFESRVARSSLINCSNEGWLSMSAAPPARRLLPFSGTVPAGPSTFTDVCKLGVCVCCHRDARGDGVAYEGHSGARDMPLPIAAARKRTMSMTNGAGAEYALRHRRRPRVSAPQHHHRPGSPFESWFVAFDTTFAEEATLRTRR